jgi:hypothetical protein
VARRREANALAVESSLKAVRQGRASKSFRGAARGDRQARLVDRTRSAQHERLLAALESGGSWRLSLGRTWLACERIVTI